MAALTHSEPQILDLAKFALAPFRAIANAFTAAMRAKRIADEAELLLAMSDAQLAAKGLAREDIPQYLLRHYTPV